LKLAHAAVALNGKKRPTLRFLAGREDAGSTPDPAAPKLICLKN